MSALLLDDGTRLEADAYVFACGPWLGKLFPDVIGDRILPTRQEVYYFGTPAGSERYLPGHLPIWIDFGERIVYGLPDTHGRGFKIADDTRGEPIDPTSANRTPSASGILRARHLLAERFPELAKAPLVAASLPVRKQSRWSPDVIAIQTAMSGSSAALRPQFKLSPAVGEMTAE
jgi:glycine/D-amino acid oxidase-like deaminating enzyme